jgi:uncharacterized repeat protein (TIGR01451 family)
MCSPEISIEKTVDNQHVSIGDKATYTITVRNDGTADAENVVVTDTLPEGLEFASEAAAGYDEKTRTLTWNIERLGLNEVDKLSFDVLIKKEDEFRNTASVTWKGADAPLVSNEAIIYAAGASDLVIEKTVDKSSVNVGKNVVFTIRAKYLGMEPQVMPMAITEGGQEPDILLIDKLPEGLQYVSDDSEGEYNPVTGEWDISALQYSNGQDGMVLKITAKVTKTGELTNTAAATINNENIYDKNPENNSDSAVVKGIKSAHVSNTSTVENHPDFTIEIIADKADVEVGDNITYTLTAKNMGTSASTDVKVTDILPSGLEYVSDNSNGAYNPSTGIWNIGFMDVNQEISITITCRAAVSGSITDTASITGTADTNMENNTSGITIAAGTKAEEVPEEPVPVGAAVLPMTGGIPAELFYGIGSALLIAGIGFKKKRH